MICCIPHRDMTRHEIESEINACFTVISLASLVQTRGLMAHVLGRKVSYEGHQTDPVFFYARLGFVAIRLEGAIQELQDTYNSMTNVVVGLRHQRGMLPEYLWNNWLPTPIDVDACRRSIREGRRLICH